MRFAAKATAFAAVAALSLWAWSMREHLGWGQPEPAASRPVATTLTKRNSIDELIAQSMHFPDITNAAKAAAPYQINICGRDSVLVDPVLDRQPKEIRELNTQTELLLAQHFERMRTSTDDVVRALALRAGLSKDSRDLERLVALGIQTKDPVAYTVALKGCNNVEGPSLCALLHPIVLTEIDPNNANSWMALAAYEQNAAHSEPAAAAFARAAQATRHDSYYAAIARRLTANAAPDPKDPLSQLQLDVALVGTITAIPTGEYAMVSRHCDKRLTDANPLRREECGAVANLIEKSDSVVEASVGLAIKERVAPSAAALAAINEQRDALKAAHTLALNPTQDLPKEDADFSCAAAQRIRAYVRDLGTIGEMGIVRRELQARDLNVAKLAQMQRTRAETTQ